MEKSQASRPPLGHGPRRQPSDERKWKDRAGPGQGSDCCRWVPKDQQAPFFQDSAQIGPVVGSQIDHVSHKIVASDPIAAASANQGVVYPLVHDLSEERAVRVLGPDGKAKATAKADPI